VPRFDKPFLVFLLASLLTMAVALSSSLRELEYSTGLDLLYNFRGSRQAPASIVIITLDSQSARALGQSERPERWPRGLHARLVAGLTERGARAIGFDVLFERAREPDQDLALAGAIKKAGNVVLIEGITREAVTGQGGEILANIDRLTQSLPLLRDAAWANGPFIMPKTPDGVVEFWGFVPSAGDRPSLPVLMAHRMTAATPDPAKLVPDTRRRTLNLYGPIGSIHTLSYTDALRLVADPVAGDAAFRGKAVLIGFSEFNQSRQSDMFRTPFSTPDGLDISGVELCATALANLLEGNSLERPSEAGMAAALLGWVVLLTLPWQLARSRRALLVTAAMALAWAALAGWSFTHLHLWLPLILPVLVAPLITTAGGMVLHTRAARQRERHLEHALALGLTRRGSDKLATLLKGHEGGRTVHGVCLCSDIEAYTSLSEALSPAATRDALNRYFARFIPVIEAHGGHVMDIVGDSLMCLWLADDSASDACRQARLAALELHRLMNGPGHDNDALPTRFGLHYGPVFLGEVGASQHRELRAVGDIVNTSSRIQGANKPLGTRILASGAVIAHDGHGAGHGHARALGAFVLAGKRSPIDLHEILAAPLPAEAARAFDTARTAYACDAPHSAAEHLHRVIDLCPDDGPGHFYLQRCQARLAGLDMPDSDGCIMLTVK
jgi:adenylate cyclase